MRLYSQHSRGMIALSALGTLALTACGNPFNPSFDNVTCGQNGECPSGYTCDVGSQICTRDSSDAGNFPDNDAAPVDCMGQTRAVISVNGATAVDEVGPLVEVAVGDTVELSAANSCSLDGSALSYEWQIALLGDQLPAPAPRFEATVLPDLVSETITLYPTVPGQYRVTLTVTEVVSGSTDTREVDGFEAFGWGVKPAIEAMFADQDARGLSVGDGFLWIAGKAGAYRAPLTPPENDAFEPLESVFSGGSILQPELKTVAYDAAEQIMWFGHKDARQVVWMLRLFLTEPSFALPAYTTNSISVVHDIDTSGQGVHLATDTGVYYTDDPQTIPIVWSLIDPIDVNTVLAASDGRLWAGGVSLYDVTNAMTYDIFPGGDDKISDIVESSDGTLWIASDGEGVARVDPASPTTPTVFDLFNSGLPSDRVRALAIDSSGDVWIATIIGAGRFKQDRQEWFGMSNYAGLRDHRDLSAIAIDESGPRPVVYAGSDTNIVYLTMP